MLPPAARQLLLNKKHMASAGLLLVLLWTFRSEVLGAFAEIKETLNQARIEQHTNRALLKLICAHGASDERERTECYVVE